MITGAARKAEAMMNRKRVMPGAKERAKVFNSMVCKGKISSVVWYISEREKEGVLLLGHTDTKTRDEVSELLETSTLKVETYQLVVY